MSSHRLPTKAVEWVAKNVFLVTTADEPGRKLGFELSAVALIHSSNVAFIDAVNSLTAHVSASPFQWLVEEHFSRYPLEGYGDIYFVDSESAHQYHSDKERTTDDATMVPNGGPPLISFQEEILRRALGRIVRPQYPNERLMKAEMVARAASDATSNFFLQRVWTAERSPRYYRKMWGTVVDVLRADVFRVALCNEEGVRRPSPTSAIFLNRGETAVVALMGVQGFDRIACGGYEGLRFSQQHYYGRTVEMIAHALVPSDKDYSNNTQLQEYEQLRHFRVTMYVKEESGMVDVAAQLMQEGHVKMVRGIDAMAPRAESFYHVLKAIDANVRKDDESASLLEQWRRYLLYGDILEDAAPRGAYSVLPLKFLLSRSELTSLYPKFQGYVSNARVDNSVFFLEITALLRSEALRAVTSTRRAESVGELIIDPPERDEPYGRHVDMTVKYEPLLSGIDPATVSIQTSIRHYAVGQFKKELHRPTWTALKMTVCPLEIPLGAREFVIDVRCSTEEPTTLPMPQRQVRYILSPEKPSYFRAQLQDLADESFFQTGAEVEDREDEPVAVAPEISDNTVYLSLIELVWKRREGVTINDLLSRTSTILYSDVSVALERPCMANGVGAFIGGVTVGENESFADLLKPLLQPLSATATEGGEVTYEDATPIRRLICADENAYLKLQLPSALSFVSLSLFPRMLFACHRRHHRNIVPEKYIDEARQWAHIDAAFMRLALPPLPCLFRMNLERLPRSLTAYSAAFSHPDLLIPSLDAGTEFVVHEKPFSHLLLFLLVITPQVENAAAYRDDVPRDCVDQFLLGVRSLATQGMAWPLQTKPSVIRHFGVPPSAALFEALRMDRRFPRAPSSASLHPLTAALGTAAMTFEENGEGEAGPLPWGTLRDDAADQVMGERGRGLDAPPRDVPLSLYRHRAHNLVVVGERLYERREPENEESTSKTGAKVFHVALKYVPVRLPPKLNNLYKVSAYGQIGREVIYKERLQSFTSGRALQDYFICLLRSTTTPCDGVLYTFGNAHEPLYLLFAARRTLRLQIPLSWKFLHGPLVERDNQERSLFDSLVTAAKRALNKAAKLVRDRQTFMRLFCFPNDKMLDIDLYPADDSVEPLEGEGAAAVSTRIDFQEYVRGRLPSARVRVKWSNDSETWVMTSVSHLMEENNAE